jgi:UDP-4-amino-4,6-dideoxy-N-acetyl-beta-L-altrosamine transaminase
MLHKSATKKSNISMIPYGRQTISESDIEAVIEVLRSDFLTQGPAVPAFEDLVARRVGALYGVAVCNATSALHLACLALELGPGDILWTTPVTFVASANCALYCGAQVGFVDIDLTTNNICVDTLECQLEKAYIEGRTPKILVAVHLAGHPCDMVRINDLSRRYRFRVIEDASHAVGSTYEGVAIGSCQYSDITVFSFHPVKIITTGEGGMALTNQAELAHRMALLRSHGITRDPQEMTEPAHGSWYYQQVALGFNYRMTDIQAALGISQMQRLDWFIESRQTLARRYSQLLHGEPIKLNLPIAASSSAYHLYIIRLDPALTTANHSKVFENLKQSGIGVNLHYIPIHLQPYYRALGFRLGDFPNSEEFYSQAISLPLYPGLTTDEQDQVVSVLKDSLSKGI